MAETVETRAPRPETRIDPIDEPTLARHAQKGEAPDPASCALRDAELLWIARRRDAQELAAPEPDALTGLALSGGGIRSAIFALGVLQALARRDLLKRFDYLSTVSGGGYIGTALTWWWSGRADKRFGLGRHDFPYGTDNPTVWRGRTPDGTAAGPILLDHLRKRGNYLTPGDGIGLPSILSILLRGAVINLAVWLPLLVVTMLALLGALSKLTGWPVAEPPVSADTAGTGALWRFMLGGLLVMATFVGLTAVYFGASLALGREAASARRDTMARRVRELVRRPRPIWLWGPALGLLALVLLALLGPAAENGRGVAGFEGLKAAVGAAIVLAFGFLSLCVVYSLFTGLTYRMPKQTWIRVFSYDLRRAFETWAGFFFGLMAVLLVVGALPFVWEEVTGRGRGLAMPGAAGGGLLALLVGFASSVVTFVKSGRATLSAAGLPTGRLPARISAAIAAAFLLFGAALLSYDLALTLQALGTLPAGIAVLALLVWSGVLGWVCDLNHVGVHRMYRDRLMEAFMSSHAGATAGHGGAASDGADRMRVRDVAPEAPYHLINTNVVLVNAHGRRRRMRGGDSFLLSPLWCGSNATGWTPTHHFMGGNMTLATAMAISGAAAHPNTGVGGVGLARSRLVATVMALFNLRLGYWVPHPRGRGQDESAEPWASGPGAPHQFDPGLSAFLPIGHREDSRRQELTDGGHFENLGLYELIRRRVRLIVLTDAGCDPGFMFADLQTALRRAGADFGATITLDEDLGRLMPGTAMSYPPGAKQAARGWITGKIAYPDGGEGLLVYLKTTLIDKLPLELLGYRGTNPDFPDESTIDQFFDEEQFEAYRELGWRIATHMLDDPWLDLGGKLRQLVSDRP